MKPLAWLGHRPLVELGLHGERTIEQPSIEAPRWLGPVAGGVATIVAFTGTTGAQQKTPRPAKTPDIVAVRTLERFEIPPYTDALRVNDAHLARIFGGECTVAAGNGFEPSGPGSRYRGGFFEGDLGHLQRNLHVYGSADTNEDGPLYIPDGFRYLGAMSTPNGKENAGHSFFYRRLGTQKNVVLRVFHVKDFAIDRTDTNEAGSIRIGGIGGPGGAPYPGTKPTMRGERRDYRHAHLELLAGATNRNDSERIPFYVAFPTPDSP